MLFKEKLFLEATGSTQDVLAKLPVPSFVFARTQRGGRGRFGRRWFSPSGGVWFSFSLENFDLKFSPLLALPVVEFLQRFSLNPRVKLPNDVLIGGKKICGILVEKRDFFMVGVGLNYLNEVPGELSRKAVSLKNLIGPDVLKDLAAPPEVAANLAEKMYIFASRLMESDDFAKDKFYELSRYVLRGIYSTRIGQIEIIDVDGYDVIYRAEGKPARAKITEFF